MNTYFIHEYKAWTAGVVCTYTHGVFPIHKPPGLLGVMCVCAVG